VFAERAKASACSGLRLAPELVVDTISPDRRSDNMRRIRSKGTKPEMIVRRLVHSLGYRFRLHKRDLPGRPDIVLRRLKRVIEVKGCFWHQHRGCIDSRIPKSRIEYWSPKLRGNVRRDKKNLTELRKLGWRVLLLWECEVHKTAAVKLGRRIEGFLSS
jgi:DNA mismatch endonuclease (patch repair protein)